MADNPYSNREIELFFKTIDTKLDTIRADIRETNKHFDSRVRALEAEVKRIDADVRSITTFRSQALAVWSVIVVAVGYFVNRFI